LKKIKINRFKDQKNNPINFFDYLYIVPAFFSYLKFKLTKKLDSPIVNYNVIKIFKILSEHKKLSILEMGSGFSTLWWEKRNIKKLISIETNKSWYDKILLSTKFQKTKIILSERKSYFKIPKMKYDLCIVDGYDRFYDLKFCLNKIDNETIIYLDDSDNDSSYRFNGRIHKDMRQAENLLREFALNHNCYILSCRGFSPSQLYVKEGMFCIPRNYYNKIKKLKKFSI